MNILNEKDHIPFLDRLKTGFAWVIGRVKVNGSNLVALSHDEDRIAVTNIAGDIVIFSLPNLLPVKMWSINEQPLADDLPPDQKARRCLNRHFDASLHQCPCALTWWNENHLVISRVSGSVGIHMIDSDLAPVTEPEWLQPFPLITEAKEGSILGLDCNMKRIGNDERDDFFLEPKESSSQSSSFTSGLKQILFYLTEIERFRPEDLPVEQIQRDFQFFRIEKTTPQRMYLRMIDAQDYGNALHIAQTYDLDTDLVYQRRWELSQFDQNSLHDFLSRIKKRSYVVEQCLSRIPKKLDDCRFLLKFGLKGTDVLSLAALGNNAPEDVPFIPEPNSDEDMYTEFDSVGDSFAQNKRFLKQVNFSTLNVAQMGMIRKRLRLLSYLDRLDTFEELNGGYNTEAAQRNFSTGDYSCFREQNIVEYAAEQARKGDWKTVETLFVYHSELAPHRLAIISSLPECINVDEYHIILPEINPETGNVIKIEHGKPRNEQDWSEEERVSGLFGQVDLAQSLYQDRDP